MGQYFSNFNVQWDTIQARERKKSSHLLHHERTLGTTEISQIRTSTEHHLYVESKKVKSVKNRE